MREQLWLSARDPESLLTAALTQVSERKLRLFACACVNRVRLFIAGIDLEQIRKACERLADGSIPSIEEWIFVRRPILGYRNHAIGTESYLANLF